MPNINLYEAYKRKVRKFGVNDSSTFRDSFADAVNLVYSELNEKVFEANTLNMIDSFDDIIDSRLASVTSMTFDDSSGVNDAIQSREFWSVEYELERLSDTNGFTDTIDDDGDDVVVSISNGVVTLTGDSVVGSADLPDVSSLTLRIESTSSGNAIYANDVALSVTYTTGDEETAQSIGTVASHVINGISGYELLSTSFNSDASLVYKFLLNEGTGTAVTSELVDPSSSIDAFTATLVSPVWEYRYVEPSTSLDSRYSVPFEMGLDYHLQDGGQWALEPEPERERKWYMRGIPAARTAYQQLTTYTSPLNP